MKHKILLFLLVLSLLLVSVQALEVSVDIPEKYRTVSPGEDLQFQVTVKNIPASGRHDISLTYVLRHDGSVVAQDRELKAVETQASFLSKIIIPSDAPIGSYQLEVIINDKDRVEAGFTVSGGAASSVKVYFIILIVVILFVGLLIWWELHKLNKKRK